MIMDPVASGFAGNLARPEGVTYVNGERVKPSLSTAEKKAVA
jgi:hypothetical protein